MLSRVTLGQQQRVVHWFMARVEALYCRGCWCPVLSGKEWFFVFVLDHYGYFIAKKSIDVGLMSGQTLLPSVCYRAGHLSAFLRSLPPSLFHTTFYTLFLILYCRM